MAATAYRGESHVEEARRRRLAAVTLASGIVATTGQAEAKGKFGPAFGIGLAAGAIFSAAIASGAYGAPVYVGPGYRCRYIKQFDDDGYYIGKVKVCDVPY